jgi:cell division septation protein DedD
MTSNKNNYSVNRYNNDQMIAANGGTVINEDMGNPNAELELNETFRDPMTGETGMVDGPSHDDGGIEMSLAEGTQIWSDRLKHNGRTFASLTKPIINKIANIEKGLNTNPNSRFKQNSIKLLNAQLDFFFNVQESNKQQDEMKRTLKKQEGGVVDDMGNYHYANGGIYIKPENRNMMAMGDIMKHSMGGNVLPKFYDAGTFGDPETEPNLADIYKNPYKTPTSNVNGIKVFNNPYDKRQFMLDQLNPNKTQYKAFDPAMSKYKANQNADLAKEKNILGAEMDQMKMISRGNVPNTMGPMNRPVGYVDPITPMQTVENMPAGYDPNAALKRAIKPYYNTNNYEALPPVEEQTQETFKGTMPTDMNALRRGQSDYENSFNSMRNAQGEYENLLKLRGAQAEYENQPFTPDIVETADRTTNITDEEKSAALRDRIDAFRKRGKIGQAATSVLSNVIQGNRLRNLAAPDKIDKVNYLDSMTTPEYVNYGVQRNAIEQGANAVSDKAKRYLGNSGSIMATVNAANLAKQQQLAESYQGQENTNAGISNAALAQRNQAAIAQGERNSAIDQENKANKYGYKAMIASGLNTNDAISASQMGQMFGNDVTFGNDLEKSRILGNRYEKKVWDSTDDNTIAANNSQVGNKQNTTTAQTVTQPATQPVAPVIENTAKAVTATNPVVTSKPKPKPTVKPFVKKQAPMPEIDFSGAFGGKRSLNSKSKFVRKSV